MKSFIEPSGFEILQEIIDSLIPYEEAMSKDDLPGLESLYRTSAKSFIELLPHITSSKLSKATSDLAQACLVLADTLENGGGFRDIHAFVKREVHKLILAMK